MMATIKLTNPHSLLLVMTNKRAIVPLLVGCLWLVPGLQSTISSVLSEAFIQVSAFVAATLAIYYGISHHLNTLGLQKWINNKPYREVLFASLMGVLPGCGGAIVIITQYTKGQIRFGAVVAVLTSTMGDAAFLLVSQRPQDALIVLPLCMAVGVISGLFTNSFLPSPVLAMPSPNEQDGDTTATSKPSLHKIDILIAKLSIVFWCVLIVPMTAVALLVAMQYDVNGLIGLPEHSIETLGAMAGFSCLLLWALSAKSDRYSELTRENDNELPKHWLRKVAQDTQFVTSWVVLAFIAFELIMLAGGETIFEFLHTWQSGSILVAALIGLLPGCGPQILVTSFYIQNTIPLSALIANAVSNDGDALFPAIALAPKAAFLATLYSFIPALIAGYGFYWLVEM